jgi:pumilio RNA-binding family
LLQDHLGNSASLSMGPPGLLFNGTADLEEGQFEPSRVHSFGPVANYTTFDPGSLWANTETDNAEFHRHVQNHFMSNMEKMNAYGTRDLNLPYLSEPDLSDALSGLRLSNRTVTDEMNHEEELLDEMLKRRRGFSTKLCDDNQSCLDGNLFCTPRSERLDVHSPPLYGDGILRRQTSALDVSNVARPSRHHIKDVDHLSFAEQLAIMGSGNFNREANIFCNATMTNMINPVGNRYNNITDFYLVSNRKASLEDVLAHQCLPDESPFHSISGLPYNDSRIYHEDPRFPYSRMQRSGSHFHPNSGNNQSHGDRQSRHFLFSRKATGRNMGSQAYHDNTLLNYLEMPLDNADRNGVDSLELVNVIGRVKEVRQVFSFFSLLMFS